MTDKTEDPTVRDETTRPPSAITPADPTTLASRPADLRVLEWLRPTATPRSERNQSPWDIDAYELHVHPDLAERVVAAARDLPGSEVVAVYGCVAVDHRRERLIAVARGTSGLIIRLEALPPGPPRISAQLAAEPGDGWLAIDPWFPEVSLPEAVPLLRRLLEAAGRRAEGRVLDA